MVQNEETPLLTPTLKAQHESKTRLFLVELLLVCRNSIPVAVAYTLQNSLQTGSIFVCGHLLGSKELSVAAFSYMLAMVTAWSCALGGSTVVDTLGSQAWTGSDNPKSVGTHLQRTIVLLHILILPILVLWFFIEPVLLALGQEAVLSSMVQDFLRVLIVGVPGYMVFECVKKYSQVQGIMHSSTVVLVVTSPVNFALNWFLVGKIGVLGAPLATSIAYYLSAILLICYMWRINGYQAWGGFDSLAIIFEWNAVKEFLMLALPGILMIATEWVAFEVVALAAGRLGETPLAAQSVIMTVDQIANTIPLGIGMAASARVGNMIGARSKAGAATAAHAAAAFSVILGSVVMAIMLATRENFGRLFSDEDDVVALVAKVLPYVAAFQIADGLAGSCGGSLRGMGRQHLGAIANAVAYYVLALPMGLVLAFKYDKGLEGLWLGQCVALFIVGIAEYMIVAFGTNWEQEIQKGVERIERAEAAGKIVATNSPLV